MALARDQVADGKTLDVRTNRGHLAHELVADDQAVGDGALGPVVPVVDVDVGAADARAVDAYEHVVDADFRFGNVFEPQAGLAFAALSFQALRGKTEALDPRIHAARPHPGQAQVAAWLRELLSGSALTDTHRGDVQDPYSLRCLPQLLGPVVETLWAVEGRLRVEMNAATDNPLILPEGRGTALAGGNFHGEILAFAAEWLGIALAELGASCERRLNALLTSEGRGLPPFLAPQPGTSSGLMLLQYTAASLASENKVLAHPAAVDSIPTSGGKEDHNAMGGTSAWKTLRIAENVFSQVTLEGVAARWAVALAGEEDLSPGSRPVYAALADLVPPPGEDQYLGEAIARVREAVREGRLSHHGV